MRFSVYILLQTHTNTRFIVPEAHFQGETIGASPLIIAHQTAKLFKFLQAHSQRKCTIISLNYLI